MTVGPMAPIAAQLVDAITAATGASPTTCHAGDRDLRLTVTPLDPKRVIVLGERYLDDFAPLQGRDASGAPLCAWHVSLARYYQRAWMTADVGHAAETILADFAPAVFQREAYQHHTRR